MATSLSIERKCFSSILPGTSTYDREYKTPNLFGRSYKELVQFFTKLPERGTVLDLGCGQGRDSIDLAKLGYQVTGIDISKVGIDQLNEKAKKLGLSLTGKVADIYKFVIEDQYDIVLLDSILHFSEKDMAKELGLLTNIADSTKRGGIICICIKKSKKREDILKSFFTKHGSEWETLNDTYLEYKYDDPSANHSSITNYNMYIQQKS